MAKRWTVEQTKKAISMEANGNSFAEIAKMVGRTEDAVRVFFGQINLRKGKQSKQEQLATVKKHLKDNQTISAISKQMNIPLMETAAMARSVQVHQVKEQIPVQDDSGCLDVINTTTSVTDPEELVKVVSQLQKMLKETEPALREVDVSVTLTQNRPIMVVFTSDWHIGSIHTDLERIDEVSKYIAETQNVYSMFSGDVFDAAGAGSKHSAITHEQVIQPAVARKLAKMFFDRIGTKMIAFTGGCHDNWSVDQIDLDQVAELSNQPYLGNGGSVNLIVGEQLYRIALRHKYSGSTTASIFTPCRNYLMKVDASADLVAVGHHHVSGCAEESIQGKPRLFIRTGSAKSIDRYADRLGLAPTREQEVANSFPAVVLWPNERRMMAFGNWKMAAEYFAKV